MAYINAPNTIVAGTNLVQSPGPGLATGGAISVTLSANTGPGGLVSEAAGLWTPILTGTTGGTAVITDIQSDYYSVGRLIFCNFNITINSLVGVTGNATIGGLPFTSAVTASFTGGLVVVSYLSLDPGASAPTGQVNSNNTTVNLFRITANGANAEPFPIADLNVGTQFIGTILYVRA